MSRAHGLSDYRMSDTPARCTHVHVEGSRSWRCQVVAGHVGRHESVSGHRHWEDSQGEYHNGAA